MYINRINSTDFATVIKENDDRNRGLLYITPYPFIISNVFGIQIQHISMIS